MRQEGPFRTTQESFTRYMYSTTQEEIVGNVRDPSKAGEDV